MLKRAQLQWLCRRGTKELDLVLQRYLDEAFDQADTAEQLAFFALLEQQDTELTKRLLVGSVEPADSLAPIIAKIRALGRF